MMRNLRLRNWSGWILGVLLCCWGCGPMPDMVSTEKKEGEAYSADEVRRMTVDQPFLLSGEYFRERDQEPKIVLDEVFDGKEKSPPGKSASKPAPKTEPVKQTAAVPSQTPAGTDASLESAGPSSPEAFAFPVKVGVVIDGERMAAGAPARIAGSVPQGMRGLPVVMADQEKVREVMTRTDCPGRRDLLCLSKALGLYPGVRMLVLVEAASLPKKPPGSVTVRMAVVDTGLLFRYPMIEAAAPVASESEVDTVLAGAMQRALAFAVDKSRVMPWYCRAFAYQDDIGYLTAGSRSGLKPGDVLTVLSPGKTAPSPTGIPAGWLPGEPKGKVRINRLFGPDFSVCALVEGEPPGPEDLLVMDR